MALQQQSSDEEQKNSYVEMKRNTVVFGTIAGSIAFSIIAVLALGFTGLLSNITLGGVSA